jgi:hypothetical protein
VSSSAAGVRLLIEAAEQLHRLVGIARGVGVPGLGAELLVERLADHVEDRLLRRADRPLRVPQDLARHGLRLLQQAVVGNDPGDQVALQRPLGVDRLRGEQHLERDAGAAGVDEADDAAVAVVEAAAGLEGAEHRPLGGDSDVAGERRLQAAGERPAVDRTDDRLVDPVHAPGEAVEAELGDLPQVVGPPAGDDRRDVLLQVGAGAKGLARAGEDGDIDRVVLGEVGPGGDHRAVDLRADRVSRLGPVDRHVGDPVALLVEDDALVCQGRRSGLLGVVVSQGVPFSRRRL